jgi:transposase, IS30 family
MEKFTQLTSDERDKIGLWKIQGISQREIARRLKRAVSTITDEISRNSTINGYEPNRAQKIAQERKQHAIKQNTIPLKSQRIYAYVVEHLRMGWSPEQISGRLKIDHQKDNNMRISYETIYKFIYSTNGKKLNFWEYLPRKQKRRKKQHGRKSHRSRIPHRVSIHRRPKRIDKRLEFGHWEGDSIESKGRKKGIHTEVERVSRFLEARKVESIDSENCISVQLKIFQEHPTKARKSTTLDNGRENHNHKKLKLLGMKAFFADPYSSWQRGTNEYHNGLIRRYLPKGTDFDSVSDEELQDIILEINSRPRKILEFKTPTEVYNSFVKVKCSDST